MEEHCRRLQYPSYPFSRKRNSHIASRPFTALYATRRGVTPGHAFAFGSHNLSPQGPVPNIRLTSTHNSTAAASSSGTAWNT